MKTEMDCATDYCRNKSTFVLKMENKRIGIHYLCSKCYTIIQDFLVREQTSFKYKIVTDYKLNPNF